MSVGAAIFSVLFMLLFFAVGILILVMGLQQIRHGRAARTWPTIDAQLQKCEVARMPSTKTSWHVALKYTYCVTGVRYGGDTLAIGAGGSSNRKHHERKRLRVLAMERFAVRYNPDKPDMSAVFLSTTVQVYWTFFMGVFWLTGTTCFTLILLFDPRAWKAIGLSLA